MFFFKFAWTSPQYSPNSPWVRFSDTDTLHVWQKSSFQILGRFSIPMRHGAWIRAALPLAFLVLSSLVSQNYTLLQLLSLFVTFAALMWFFSPNPRPPVNDAALTFFESTKTSSTTETLTYLLTHASLALCLGRPQSKYFMPLFYSLTRFSLLKIHSAFVAILAKFRVSK